MNGRSLPVVLLLGALLASGGSAGVGAEPPSSSAFPATSPSVPVFGQPTMSGIQGNGFELDVRVAPDGTIYTSAPGSLSSDTSWVWRSLDGGDTFKWTPAAVPLDGKFGACPGGGDTELAVDTAGHLYYADLTLANFSVARSDDRGTTLAGQNCAAVETAPNDRQWYAVDGDPTAPPSPNNVGNLYLTYNIFAGGFPLQCPNGALITANNQLVLARSPAFGAPRSTAGIQFAPSRLISGPCEEAIMGNVEISPATHQVFIPHPDAFRTSMRVARCEAIPFSTDPTGLSCVERVVTEFPNSAPAGCVGASCTGFKTGANFPSLAIDGAGNLYVIWQQAAVNNCGVGCFGQGDIVGDTLLYWSSSADNGDTWTTPVQIPTPGLHQNVFTWAAAGDEGRVGVAWYGSDAPTRGLRGPDSSPGDYGVYFSLTTTGTDPIPTFTPPVLASQRTIHRGTMFTVIGRQTGDRALGDFLYMQMGRQGEAIIAYGDSTNGVPVGVETVDLLAKGMIVRQIDGPGGLADQPVVGDPPPAGNGVTDAPGDATYDANGRVSATQPNLDVLASAMTKPVPADCHPAGSPCYRVTMDVRDLTSLAPNPATGNSDSTLVWNTQWNTRSGTTPCASHACLGGINYFVSMESTAGGPPRFLVGQAAQIRPRAGRFFTYPGAREVEGSYSATAPGTITIDVPIAAVVVPEPVDAKLYNVTASTMTLPEPSDTVPRDPATGVGGSLFNLIDVASGYDFVPAEADVAVTKTDSPDPAHRGQPLTYTIGVINNGPATANAVRVVDPLPRNAGFGSASATEGSCTVSRRVVTCELGALPAGNRAIITIVVRPLDQQSITNTATVTAASPPDPDPTNNSATATTDVTP